MTGLLIAIEGIDPLLSKPSAQRVNEALRAKDIPCAVLSTPSNGPIGLQIGLANNRYIDLPETSIAILRIADFLDFAFHPEIGISSLLADNQIVLVSGYLLTFYADYIDRFSKEWLKAITQTCLVPDLTLFLDFSLEQYLYHAQAQFDKRRNQSSPIGYDKLRKQYLSAITQSTDLSLNVKIISCDVDMDQITDSVLKEILNRRL